MEYEIRLSENIKMNEFTLKIVTILEEKISKKDKVIKCFIVASGLEISALSLDQQNRIYKQLSIVNGILKQYPIKTYDDYSLISDSHLNQLIKSIRRIGSI